MGNKNSQRQWRIRARKVDFYGYAARLGVSPVMVRLMCNRGMTDISVMEKYLHPDRYPLYDPLLLKDMDKAVSILEEKINSGSRVRIVGDYDVDGVCSVAILWRGLSDAGANVDWYIPDRVKDGYGLNINIVKAAIDAGIDTILTCDNGISAASEVEYAVKAGMTVIVTDHHEVPMTGAPRADAVVDPKQEDCHYPFKGLCGAAVVYKLISVLYDRLRMEMDPGFLELAAIATVCDVMELTDENRLIVSTGLRQLKAPTVPGIRALADACGLTGKDVSAYHLGFILGPCLNAPGRLENASVSERLLQKDAEDDEAKKLAQRLKELNDRRKELTQKGLDEACVMADKMTDDRVLVLYVPDCGESVAGIVAGKVREKYYKPVIVLTDSAQDPDMAKGSGRSIEGYSMFARLEEAKDLLGKFGGHPMAAGMSIPKKNIEKFRQRLNDRCTLTEEQLTEKMWIDLQLPVERLDFCLLSELDILEPCGKGNEKPVFADKDLRVVSARRIGQEGQYLKLVLGKPGAGRIEALLFNRSEEFLEEFEHTYGEETLSRVFIGLDDDDNPTDLSIVYYPSVNDYRGDKSIQIVINDYHMH